MLHAIDAFEDKGLRETGWDSGNKEWVRDLPAPAAVGSSHRGVLAMSTFTAETTFEIRTDVSWDDYVRLRESQDESGVRLTYHDGTLVLMSPEYLHEGDEARLSVIIREIADALDIAFASAGSTTFRRKGDASRKGSGKEPDASFYLGENSLRIWGKTTIDLDVDPPPDLAIEVENKADSEYALPVYVALRVPEVWLYNAREAKLRFGRLVGQSYEPIARSVSLPILTPGLVIEAIEAAELVRSEKDWIRWVRAWAKDLADGRIQ
jgi:Uma2 family endonuclease